MTVSKDMAPISQGLIKVIQAEIIEKMTCHGKNIYQMVLIDKQNEMKDESFQEFYYGIIVSSVLLATIVFVILGYLIYKRVQTNKLLKKRDWEIPIEDILFYTTGKSTSTGKSRSVLNDLYFSHDMLKHT